MATYTSCPYYEGLHSLGPQWEGRCYSSDGWFPICNNHIEIYKKYEKTQAFPGGYELRLINKVPVGTGGAPTRASILPENGQERKEFPVGTGFLDYFPDAVAAVANVSFRGNQQHNPGQPLHWDRSKSTDEPDTMIRHFLQRGTLDTDGIRHSAKMAWRALALLQKEIENESKL